MKIELENDLSIWREIVDQINKNSKLELERSCVWLDVLSNSDYKEYDFFKKDIAKSSEYTVFFLRALLGDLNESWCSGWISWEKDKLSVTDTETIRRLKAVKNEDVNDADLIARMVMILAWKICLSFRCKIYPTLDGDIDHPEVHRGDTNACQLRFLSADFVEGKIINQDSNKTLQNDRIWYQYEWDETKDDCARKRGWRMQNECEFLNNPYDVNRREGIESFTGFPAFFYYDSAKIIFYYSDEGNCLEKLNEKVSKLLRRDASFIALYEKAILPYGQKKLEDFEIRKKNGVYGSITLCLGTTVQHAAFFDPKKCHSTYGLFFTVDVVNQNNVKIKEDINFVKVCKQLERSRYLFQHEMLQALTAKLFRETMVQRKQLEERYEIEKRHARILAQIQQPLQSIVYRLFGVQASVQQINATLFAPQLSLFSVAPIVAKYFNDKELVSFGDYAWYSAHSELNGNVEQLRNAIAAIVLHTLGGNQSGISSPHDLYLRAVGELFKSSSSNDPRHSLFKVFRQVFEKTAIEEITNIFFAGTNDESELKGLLQNIFSRLKQIVFTPFKPDAFEWPFLPMVLLANDNESCSQVQLYINAENNADDICRSFDSISAYIKTKQEFLIRDDRTEKDDLLCAFTNQPPPPIFPISIYSHLLDFVLGVLRYINNKNNKAAILKVRINQLDQKLTLEIGFNEGDAYLQDDQMNGIFQSMQVIIENHIGAGQRGDFARPYLVFAERCSGADTMAKFDKKKKELTIKMKSTHHGNARQIGLLSLSFTDNSLCINMKIDVSN